MNNSFPLENIQSALRADRLDGWLFYYFQGNDPIAEKILDLGRSGFLTRRCFYFIPKRGEPVKLVHRIERHALAHLPGTQISFLFRKEMEKGLTAMLRGKPRVAMQYSPRGAVPYISRVDAGAMELVRATGARPVSSGDLVQTFEAPITPAQWEQHKRTADALRRIVLEAFGFIRRKILAKKPVDEQGVQRFILGSYRRRGLISNSDPIVAVNNNSAEPHYVPSRSRSHPIHPGDWVLLDIWAKPRGADAIYADITWCGYVGRDVPEKHEKIFRIVRDARDKALGLIKNSFEGKRPRSVRGWEADRAARGHIERHGYGQYFIHRTGHSIGREDHANGANLDSLETKEMRRLLPNTLFSIEPGIYLKDFGARSEINVFIDGNRVRVSGGPVQTKVVPILGNIPHK